jgi:hypothetical protein
MYEGGVAKGAAFPPSWLLTSLTSTALPVDTMVSAL